MTSSTGPTPSPRPSFLSLALAQTPHLTLDFYQFGIVLTKQRSGLATQYLVDPQHVALALGAHLHYDTGLIPENTLLVIADGADRIVAEWRKPQMTGIWLEGSERPFRVALPSLILIRHSAGHQATYQLWATAERKRPAALAIPLYETPLPNVTRGLICWGSVARESKQALAQLDLREAWAQILGSRFGNHGVPGKSRKYPHDIRELFRELEQHKSRSYPLKDLIPANKTLADVLRSAAP